MYIYIYIYLFIIPDVCLAAGVSEIALALFFNRKLKITRPMLDGYLSTPCKLKI